MNRGFTPIGLVIILAVAFVAAGLILNQFGLLDSGNLGGLGKALKFSGETASKVVPVPKVNEVKDIGQKTASVLTGGGGFDFDENTPGYENYLQLSQGCPFKDCIPSIDDPSFESVSSADSWLESDDVVFALDYKGEARAYAQRIMNWHEIVNDEVAGDPLAITFCPLCGSALAFDRRVDGQVLEFGVSGKLHNNDLVMYDRQTETLWQQITGEAIVGELFGNKLTQVPMSGMRWSQFKEEFPGGQVLSRNTGFSRNYDRYPYGDYEQDASTLFPVSGGVDDTIHPKTVVYGVEIENSYKAYPEDKIKEEGKISDLLGGVELEIDYNGGDVKVTRLDSGEEIPGTRLFWFAWKAFRSETELYD